jgi:hypothetical protein
VFTKKKKKLLVTPLIIKCKSCPCKEYSRSHQTLDMFTLPKLILIHNNWSINTTIRSFECVYFRTYLAPAWNKHSVSVSNQVFQRCELQLRAFWQWTFCINFPLSQWKSKDIKPKTSSQMYPFGATHFLPVSQPPSRKNLLSHQETSWRWIARLDVLPDILSD